LLSRGADNVEGSAMCSVTSDVQRPEMRRSTEQVARGIRRRVLAHTLSNNGGYLSQACSSAEILATLYTRVMRLGPSEAPLIPRPFAGPPGPQNPHSFTGADYNGRRAPHLDRFIFSPVHYALVLYATLIEVGRLGENALDAFNKDGSTVELIGAEHSPGHEVTAGSLGQAISQAAGIAMARKRKGDTGRVFLFMSDGEFQEGQVWEAIQSLSFYELDNVAVYVDMNGQCCDGAMESVMTIEPLAERLAAFGASVRTVDGHDVEALASAATQTHSGKPLVVLATTDPCREMDLLKARAPKLHYVRFKTDEERRSYEARLTAFDAMEKES
jgi:transketolase